MKRPSFLSLLTIAALSFVPADAQAGITLSQMIVELQPGKSIRQDVELWNNDPDRTYVVIEAREVVNAGRPDEASRVDPDPEKLGLLVSPGRLILEPGQHKLIRIASIAPPGDRERVYRVMVKPVAGELVTNKSGLKIMVGYDALVIVRPPHPRADLIASRTGNRLTFHNSGNSSVELVQGRQCTPGGTNCSELPGKRLYAGADWGQDVKPGYVAEYSLRSATGTVLRRF
ncbi:MAG: fimbria/pilus periplasmic chaperone [Sphingomicrobium sp.]